MPNDDLDLRPIDFLLITVVRIFGRGRGEKPLEGSLDEARGGTDREMVPP
jgi:hypothetical protein